MGSGVITVRPELPRDRLAIRDVLVRAFPGDGEARLVEALRGRTDPQVSLVADAASGVIGHILFTPVAIRGGAKASSAIGLGPMAVLPEHQRSGVGSLLIRAGLAACVELGEPVVVVLGHPDYYPRFGFVPAWDHGLYYARAGANPAFMVCELERGALRRHAGEVVYAPAFDEV